MATKKVAPKTEKKVEKLELNPKVWGVDYNEDLVAQVLLVMRSNARQGNAHAKTRADVSGGGRKPWKQKGTGRARHGSSRSPIWVGGGVTHGPLAEKNYKRKISKKMRAQALFSVLSRKLKDNEIIFVDSLALTDIKTKQAVRVMENLAKATGFKSLANSKKKRVLIAIYGRSEKTEKSFRNLPQLELVFLKNLNPLDVLNYQYLVIENPKESIEFLESRG